MTGGGQFGGSALNSTAVWGHGAADCCAGGTDRIWPLPDRFMVSPGPVLLVDIVRYAKPIPRLAAAEAIPRSAVQSFISPMIADASRCISTHPRPVPQNRRDSSR